MSGTRSTLLVFILFQIIYQIENIRRIEQYLFFFRHMPAILKFGDVHFLKSTFYIVESRSKGFNYPLKLLQRVTIDNRLKYLWIQAQSYENLKSSIFGRKTLMEERFLYWIKHTYLFEQIYITSVTNYRYFLSCWLILIFLLNYKQIIAYIHLMNGVASYKFSSSKIDNPQVFFVKHMTPKRWKKFMLEILQSIDVQEKEEHNLIADLKTITQSVPDAYFIEAALEARPFKPEFIEQPMLKGNTTQSTTTSTVTKAAKFREWNPKVSQKNLKKQRITESNLKTLFNKEQHPYFHIIKNFCRLLQLKYKQLVDKRKSSVGVIQKKLRKDLDIFAQYICKSSNPYRKLLKNQINLQEELLCKKLNKFVESYLFDHTKLNSTCHKIILYACRFHQQQRILSKIQDFATPEQYDIEKDYQIDGCYIRSMNSLMQFAQSSDHRKSMDKLLQFRRNILEDIDQYYINSLGQQKQLEVSAEVQIEIIRFIVGKLKGWACEIYSQIKYLQVIYGQEDIAYKYEQASFIYTQLVLTFQILKIQ